MALFEATLGPWVLVFDMANAPKKYNTQNKKQHK